MQYPCNAFGLLSKKQYAPKAEIRFMIKLLTDLWRECTICAVFFSISLMVSIIYLLRNIIVIERHQLVFHIYAQPCYQLYSILKKEVKQLLRNIPFVCEQLAIQTFSKNLGHIRILIADIRASKYKCYYLASVIARKVELEAMAPTHCSLSVSGNSLKHLVGVSPEIVAYGYHRGIDECYASTSSESSQIKKEHELEEHAAFQLHKAVVRHSFRKIRLHRTLNEEQVVVLEIAECTEMEIQQNRHYFTV